MTVKSDQTVAYRMTAEEVVAELGSDPRHGLSGQDASARLRQYGPNELETEKPEPAWRRFLAQFQDVLIILLLVATAISVGLWVYERDSALPYEGMTIFAIVLLNGILATFRRLGPSRRLPHCGRCPRTRRPCCATASDRACPRRSWCRATSS